MGTGRVRSCAGRRWRPRFAGVAEIGHSAGVSGSGLPGVCAQHTGCSYGCGSGRSSGLQWWDWARHGGAASVLR